MSDPNSFPFCFPPGYFFQNFYESYPYRNSTTPMPATTGSSQPGQSSGSSQSGRSGSGTSTPTSEIGSTSTSTEENKKQDKKKGKAIATQDRWTEDQVKYLVDLWEANISRLESQQSGKVLSEIASKVNEHFNIVRLPSQCERKIKHLNKRKQNASAMARGQQSNCQKTNFGQILWSLPRDI